MSVHSYNQRRRALTRQVNSLSNTLAYLQENKAAPEPIKEVKRLRFEALEQRFILNCNRSKVVRGEL